MSGYTNRAAGWRILSLVRRAFKRADSLMFLMPEKVSGAMAGLFRPVAICIVLLLLPSLACGLSGGDDTAIEKTGTPAVGATSGPLWRATSTLKGTLSPTKLPSSMAQIRVARANVRAGPGTAYPVVTRVAAAERYQIVARSGDEGWYLVVLADDRRGWISVTVVELITVDTTPIPLAETIPPLPAGP